MDGFRPTPPRNPPKNPKPNAPVFAVVKEAVDFNGQKVSNDGRYEAINGRLVVKTPAEEDAFNSSGLQVNSEATSR